MPTPHDVYTRFLLTTGAIYDEVCEAFKVLRLPEPSGEDVSYQEDFLEKTLPPYVQDRIKNKAYHGDFLRWMKILEVDDLWYLEKPFRLENRESRARAKLIVDVHEDPKLRLAINSLLIKGIPPKDLVNTIASKHTMFLKEEHVRAYSKIFFSVQSMTRKHWRQYIKTCGDQGYKDEGYFYLLCLSEPLDVVKTELELTAKINSSEILQYLLSKAYSNTKDMLKRGNVESRKEALPWIDTVIKLVDKYEKYRSADASDFGSALQLEFSYIDNDFDLPDVGVLEEIQEKLSSDTKPDQQPSPPKS